MLLSILLSCVQLNNDSELIIDLVDNTEEHLIVNVQWEQISNVPIETGAGLSRVVNFVINVYTRGQPQVYERQIQIGFNPYEGEYYFKHVEYNTILRFSEYSDFQNYLGQPISFFLDSTPLLKQDILSIQVEAAIPYLSESSIFRNWIFRVNEFIVHNNVQFSAN